MPKDMVNWRSGYKNVWILIAISNSGYQVISWLFRISFAKARNGCFVVGPGRGSAAGSAVAYCLKITNIDPIKYDLLFWAFLESDRIHARYWYDFMRRSWSCYGLCYKSTDPIKISLMVKWRPNQLLEIPPCTGFTSFEADRIAKLIPAMMPSKWNLARSSQRVRWC
jgi:DNA polymerase-3 subunit alpha